MLPSPKKRRELFEKSKKRKNGKEKQRVRTKKQKSDTPPAKISKNRHSRHQKRCNNSAKNGA